jgi:hypothetical protein
MTLKVRSIFTYCPPQPAIQLRFANGETVARRNPETQSRRLVSGVKVTVRVRVSNRVTIRVEILLLEPTYTSHTDARSTTNLWRIAWDPHASIYKCCVANFPH